MKWRVCVRVRGPREKDNPFDVLAPMGRKRRRGTPSIRYAYPPELTAQIQAWERLGLVRAKILWDGERKS